MSSRVVLNPSNCILKDNVKENKRIDKLLFDLFTLVEI